MKTLIVSAAYVPIQANNLIILSSFEELRQIASFFKKPIVKHKGSFFVFDLTYVYAFMEEKTYESKS